MKKNKVRKKMYAKKRNKNKKVDEEIPQKNEIYLRKQLFDFWNFYLYLYKIKSRQDWLILIIYDI